MAAPGVDQWLAAVHAAILNDDVAQLAEACSSGVNLNQVFTSTINQQHEGMTPMALACALNKTHLAEVLLDHGAHVDFPFAALQTTALMTSAFHGNIEAVTLLLKNQANVRALDMQKSTALGYAFGGTRNIDVIQLLLNAGVDVNQKNVLGMSAMLLVAGYGNDELVAMVLDAGGDPRARNDFGHTALHLAVVGKKDQLKKMKRLGSIEAAAADRSLNRRNLDLAMQEWARLHRDTVGDTGNQESLAKVGQFMMSIGQNLDDEGATNDDDEQEAMKRRVAAVWKHRQEKIRRAKEKRRPAFIATLLSCGGGKGRQAADTDTASRPYAAPAENDVGSTQRDPSSEVSKLSERYAHILRMLVDAKCEINETERTFGMTALDMAILNGDVESSTVLVSASGDPDHLMKMFALSDLYEVLVLGQRKELKDLLLFDDDVDINQPFSRFNITRRHSPGDAAVDTSDEGLTALTVAVRTNDINAVKMLIRHGADINAMGPGERSPLGETAAKNFRKVAEILVQYGVNIEDPIPAYNNATPVVVAAFMGSHAVVDLLLRRNAKVDKAMDDGSNSLVKAFTARDMEMVHKLLRADLLNNFDIPEGNMHRLATAYQDKDRVVENILEDVSNWAKEVQSVEDDVMSPPFSPKPIDLDSNANTPVRPAPAPPVAAPLHRQLFKQDEPTEQQYAEEPRQVRQVQPRDAGTREVYQQDQPRDAGTREVYQQEQPRDAGTREVYQQDQPRDAGTREVYQQDQPRDAGTREVYQQEQPRDAGTREVYQQEQPRDAGTREVYQQEQPRDAGTREVYQQEQPAYQPDEAMQYKIQQPPAGDVYIVQPPTVETLHIQQPPQGEIQQIRQPATMEIREIRQPPTGEVQQIRQQPEQEMQQIRRAPAREVQQMQQPQAREVQQIRQPPEAEMQEIRQPPAGDVQQIRRAPAGEVQQIRQPPAADVQQVQQPILQTFAAPPAQVQQQKQFAEQVEEGHDDEDDEEESSEEESSEEETSEEEDEEHQASQAPPSGPVQIQRDVVQSAPTPRQQFVTLAEPPTPPPPLPLNGPPADEDVPASRIPVAKSPPGVVMTTRTVRTTTVTTTAPGRVPTAVMEDIPDIDDESDEEEPLPTGGAVKPAEAGGSSKETTL